MKKLSFSIFLFAICFFVIDAESLFAAASAKSGAKTFAVKAVKAGRESAAKNGNSVDREKMLPAQNAQQTAVWQQVSEDSLKDSAPLSLESDKYLVFQLNKKALTQLLARVPAESQDVELRNSLIEDNAVIMELPLPDGTLARFRVEESSVLAPELAAQFPEIKSYRGRGVDDPSLTTRFDWTPQGFHALILSGGEAVNVEPANQKDTSLYVSYNGDAVKDKIEDCLVEDFHNDKSLKPETDAPTTDAAQIAFGGTLRTYRLALAADYEYTTNYGGGTTSGTLTSLNTWVNGANAVYERELSVHLNLIANETSIIYTTASDPYDNTSPTTLLNNAVSSIDATVGRANYDVGHVFGTIAGSGQGGSGVAYVGVVNQNSTLKGGGATQLLGPVGNSTALGVWVHELGHQFSANHNFNGTQNGCGGGNRNPGTSYETGSGETIMAYSGICGTDNITSSRDMRFHAKSLDAITSYITSAANCPYTCPASGNTPPTVSGGGNHNIPKNTPFTLTATGSDPNGDTLTYTWDEIDAGGASYPQDGTDASYNDTNDPTTTTRPIFRSFPAVTSPSRTFPQLGYILSYANDPPNTLPNGLKSAEELPRVGRTLNFRVTARDNHSGSGGVNDDTVVLTVDGNSGPFLVTSPNTNVTLSGNSALNVTWSVNNTNAAPISATNVKISLSTDGGNTFPTVLAASTPNTGSAFVTVPNVTTTAARIKVEAVDNVFFDIDDANFAINAAPVVINYEADVYPRASSDGTVLGGDGAISSTDVSVIQGFQLGFGLPYQGNELQRADCAPFNTRGDGQVTSIDVAQAQGYQLGLYSPPQPAAGPTGPAGGAAFAGLEFDKSLPFGRANQTDAAAGIEAGRVVRVVNTSVQSSSAAQTVTVPINVDAMGDESVYGFSISYDATKLSNPVVTRGSADIPIPVTNRTTAGQIGVSINFGGGTITARTDQPLLFVQFTVAAGAAAGATPIAFTDTPTVRQVASAPDPDPTKPVMALPTTFTDGSVTITAAPTAAQASIGGRVTNAGGRGISGVTMVLTDSNGAVRTTRTTTFGYYRFSDVAAGETVVLSARAKRYNFAQQSQVLSISGDVGAVNFVGIPVGW